MAEEEFRKIWEKAQAAKAGVPASPPQPKKEIIDPFVFASQVAVEQPKDKAWRLFMGVMFRVDDVVSVHVAGPLVLTLRGHPGQPDCCHRFDLPIKCDNPTKWFAEHVLGFEFGVS